MMTADQQLEYYRTRFGRLITRSQLQQFSSDLARCNLDVMSAALKQAAAAATSSGRPPRDVRLAVLSQYDRIAASITQLFPVFFVFESAWRSYVAAGLDAVYGSGDWWHVLRDLVAQGADTSAIASLGGRPVSAELVRTVVHALGGVAGGCGRLASTYEFVEEASLGHLEKLIQGHWSALGAGLNQGTALGPPTWGRFESTFRRVRRARNDAYHHRVVADRATVVAAAEQLLDLLDVHLGTRVASISGVALPPLQFKVGPQERHD